MRKFEPWDREIIERIIEETFRPYPNAMIGDILCQVYDELLAAEAMVALLQSKLAKQLPSISVPSCWVSDGTDLPTTVSVDSTGIISTVFIDTLARTVLPTVAKAVQQ